MLFFRSVFVLKLMWGINGIPKIIIIIASNMCCQDQSHEVKSKVKDTVKIQSKIQNQSQTKRCEKKFKVFRPKALWKKGIQIKVLT